MATTYNIVEKRYNGTDYDTLYPATKGENLVSPVPVELGGTGGTTGAAGMKNLLDALSTVTPTGTDLLPLKDVSGNIAGKATVDSILSLVSGGAKIQTGSYVGTGTYGQANPCSLTFDFKPIALFITVKIEGLYVPAQVTTSYPRATGMFTKDSAEWFGGRTSSSYGNCAQLHFTWGNNSVSWYADVTSSNDLAAESVFNWTNYNYYYVAIG